MSTRHKNKIPGNLGIGIQQKPLTVTAHEHAKEQESILAAVAEFYGHALGGAAIFLLMAALSFGLSKFVHFLEEHQASVVQIFVFTALEYALLFADVLLVLIFIWNAISGAIKKVWK
ncbi:hypothetical protein Herbaro_09285 [Herbaspirillum sp. WKF16]|uniref:hypothetical protein n=1 Tax=Herbaspirillum sp. WKF16 TaxID=3028312 RepID=UPI0023A9F77E|nr:hypothetical protein [Herbaspirillum sp. WKF16]WDZ97953.1 hypothetical protein Herbaro_09285 [Herbaspirillum sp. WKF16]